MLKQNVIIEALAKKEYPISIFKQKSTNGAFKKYCTPAIKKSKVAKQT